MARANLAAEARGQPRGEQGDAGQRTHPAVEATGAEGCGRPRRRMGCFQSYPSQGGAGLDARLPGAVEGRGLGLVTLGTARWLRRARQPARGRRIRELPRPQARPRDAEPVATRVAAREEWYPRIALIDANCL